MIEEKFPYMVYDDGKISYINRVILVTNHSPVGYSGHPEWYYGYTELGDYVCWSIRTHKKLTKIKN